MLPITIAIPTSLSTMVRDSSPIPESSQESVDLLCHSQEREASAAMMAADDAALWKMEKKVRMYFDFTLSFTGLVLTPGNFSSKKPTMESGSPAPRSPSTRSHLAQLPRIFRSLSMKSSFVHLSKNPSTQSMRSTLPKVPPPVRTTRQSMATSP